MSFAVIGLAAVFLAVTCVTASSWINTPLYTYRMEQVSSEMSFLPTELNKFSYTVENGYTVNYTFVSCCGANPMKPPTEVETCPETCDGETCPFTACGNTCGSTCPNTSCGNTCDTCTQPTCETCETCSTCTTCSSTCSTCKGQDTCWDTCEIDCW
jgi:hypothetical protein